MSFKQNLGQPMHFRFFQEIPPRRHGCAWTAVQYGLYQERWWSTSQRFRQQRRPEAAFACHAMTGTTILKQQVLEFLLAFPWQWVGADRKTEQGTEQQAEGPRHSEVRTHEYPAGRRPVLRPGRRPRQ